MFTLKNSFVFVLLWLAMTLLFFVGTIIFSAYLAKILNFFVGEAKMLSSLYVISTVPVWVCAVYIVASEHLVPRELGSRFIFLFVPLLVGDVLYFFVQSDPAYGLIFSATFLAYHMSVTMVRKDIIST